MSNQHTTARRSGKVSSWRLLQILDLYSKGASARQISTQLNVPRTAVTRALEQISQEQVEAMRDYTTKEIPLQIKASIVNLRNLQLHCHAIASEVKDPRVKLLAYQQIADYQTTVNDLLVESSQVVVHIDELQQRAKRAQAHQEQEELTDHVLQNTEGAELEEGVPEHV